MSNFSPSAKLKMNQDTFFLPDSDGGVYFRNNVSSFRMQGDGIYEWIEKLMPMFNGKHTLEELTNGLPLPYQKRVFEIGELLYTNGFVRDVSQNAPHQLDDTLLERYASQIEFLEASSHSGALHFQTYRQANVLAIGSGPMLISLVASLLTSGLPTFHYLITDRDATNLARLDELIQEAQSADQGVSVQEIETTIDCSLAETFEPFDWILYVSQNGNIDKLRLLDSICQEEKKNFIPAIYLEQVGLVGPIITSDCRQCWESAWHRMHETALHPNEWEDSFSPIAGAMLANVLVFELFKEITGASNRETNGQFFLLDLETLEGNWHSFVRHPLTINNCVTFELLTEIDKKLEQDAKRNHSHELFRFFDKLTSRTSGIFHMWEEDDLQQLPLSQCYIQIADPLSEGPTALLPPIICSGFTHDEARRSAGLTGIETYVSKMIDFLLSEQEEFIGIGAGETMTEGIYRAFQHYFSHQLCMRQTSKPEEIIPLELTEIADKQCRFYFDALRIACEEPTIGMAENLYGFPVIWVQAHHKWYGSAHFNVTLALRNALQQALSHFQNEEAPYQSNLLWNSSILMLDREPCRIEIQTEEVTPNLSTLQNALQKLKEQDLYPYILDLSIEPFLKEGLSGVFGVVIKEEVDEC
ncbi:MULTISPECIES: putative thiazole-containing bacteriocin maturation protein [Bacillus cereus group]|uniref:Group-specific protein n=1 Tax=Bacillus cytotoxicus (strain DSM 22905 / CIP 110041 / 391-98 / NVH 391-98) TaxID=315749 RepID=A7GMD2_BACCN|nr:MULTISPECIES: putative thiazole-containing bacteriocin maturation protein [Bacillus cereus group]ABS21290.1 group-specific protein [Bacillus cytotoxicus NVH 391-98]AWC27933.1 putative thiazole-containing bacteriocin maturation protein [Bacillus cytotoxicus]AWC40685.1 putative thiazole-containing bacteriocin maturation protein [Bacillus cytotoxicus]AWC44010.1 putative thiazole-containing bacteriocin maturation protein [Bacillus cytotoxicus]AWC48616.1 putative thiazole-containing bacteriocin 